MIVLARLCLWAVVLCWLQNGVRAQGPEIVDEIWPEVQHVGRTGRLNCTVTNKGNGVVMWEHVDTKETISMDEDIVIPLNRTIDGLSKFEVQTRESGDRLTYMLIIRRLLESDAGTYKCTIRIQAIPYDQWPSKLGRITVQVPPRIRLGDSTNILEVDQGQNVSLICAASGVPSPNITWTRLDGSYLQQGVKEFRAPILPIKNVNVNDAGVYRCVANNSINPPAELLAQLLVFHAPETQPVQNAVGQAKDRGFDAQLECIVKGYPEPNVTWERLVNDSREPITDDDKYDIRNQTTEVGEQWYTLKVKNVQANDFTDYFCIATNSKGRHESNITLFVRAQDPEIVDEIWPEVQQVGRTGRLNCTVANNGNGVVVWEHVDTNETISRDEDIVISLNPTANGLPKYEVQQRESGDLLTYMLIIRRLLESDAGTYKCTIQIQTISYDQWPYKLGNLTVQETMECQGPNCPSPPTGRAPFVHLSALAIIPAVLWSLRSTVTVL